MPSLPDSLKPSPAGRDRLPKEVMEEHQRDRVLRASVAVFAKRGFQATTVDHLVAASKTGVGSFYALFEGKEDCFLQAYDIVVADARARIAESLPEDGTPVGRVVAALGSLLDLIAAEPLSARLVIVEAQTAGPAALARYESTLQSLVPPLRDCREASPIAAELSDTVEDAILGGVVWLLHQRLVRGEVEGIEKLFPDLVDVVLAPYLGEDASGLSTSSA